MSDIQSMSVKMGVASVINLAEVTVHPVETVSAVMELWRARNTLKIAPGQTRVVMAPFRDENGERVGAVEVVEPVATTDFTVNDDPSGGGFDYTNSPHFNLDTDIEATRVIFTIENTATGPLYVTLLKIRGKAIRVWDAVTVEVEDSTSQTDYEVRAARLDLALQGDENFAQSYAEYLVGRFKEPVLVADTVTVREELVGDVNVFSLGLMDKVLVNDPGSGATMLQHWIKGIEYDISGQNFSATFHLDRADDRKYWLLGKSGYGELGVNTRLGF